mgnify:FL=1
MTELLKVSGSFATVWLLTWFSCALLLATCYPLLRPQLMRWHPAIASNLLLLLLAFPLLLSLSTAALIFLPLFEFALVSDHCHDNCAAHSPLIEIAGLAETGLLLTLMIACFLCYRLLLNLRVSRNLQRQLRHLTTDCGSYRLLDSEQAFVFTLGWWRNEVYLTSGLQSRCTEDDLAIILAHEYAHSRRRDNVRLLAAMLFNLVLPGSLGKQMQDDYHLLIESACDFAAAEGRDRLSVAETLLKIQKLSPDQWQFGKDVILSALTGSEVELRVRALIHGRNESLAQQASLQLSFLMLVFASISLVDPLHHGIEILLMLN